MQTEPPTPDDEETSAPDEETAADAPRPSSPFSATRASRIRRSSSRLSGAIPGRAPLPGGEQTTPGGAPDASTTTQAAQPRRPSGPRTYAHLAAGACYLAPPIVPIAVLFSPAAHRFARFHALQALALFVVEVTLGFLLSLFTPTNLLLDILYALLVIAVVALVLLWMAAAIASLEGFAVALPLLDRLIPRTDHLVEDQSMQGINPRATLETAIAAGAGIIILLITIWLPLGGWFGKLSPKALAPLGLSNGLPVWMVVSSLLFSLIFAAVGLTALAVLVMGLHKGKFLPSLASGAAVVASALVAAGTGLLIADTLQRSIYGKLEQQFQNMVTGLALPAPRDGTAHFAQTIIDGRSALATIAQAEHSLLAPGIILLLLGLGTLAFLLSQLYYKK
jgi:uncharacterized membrane protein